MTAPNVETTLRKRLAELTSRLAGIETELDSHHDADWEELAVEREGDEVLEGIGQQGLSEIRQIKAALARIEDGSYGSCARCGADIAAERLSLLPHTPFCAACAK